MAVKNSLLNKFLCLGILVGRIMAVDTVRKKGIHLTNRCCLCNEYEETVRRLLLYCQKIQILGAWYLTCWSSNRWQLIILIVCWNPVIYVGRYGNNEKNGVFGEMAWHMEVEDFYVIEVLGVDKGRDSTWPIVLYWICLLHWRL